MCTYNCTLMEISLDAYLGDLTSNQNKHFNTPVLELYLLPHVRERKGRGSPSRKIERELYS